MNKKIYSQIAAAYANLAYPTKASSFGGNGCGCCSVLHVIIEQKKYAAYTPKSIIGYMKQYAVPGNGTTWQGIYDALRHYGMANVKWFGRTATMASVFEECDKGSRLGVILFSSGSGPDGTVFTAGGHYIAFTGYKKEGSRHWFYLKDSGGRGNSGWICYEQTMKGLVSQVWTCTLPEKTKAERINENAIKTSYGLGTSPKKYAYKGGKPRKNFLTFWKKYWKLPKNYSGCHQYVRLVLKMSGYKTMSLKWDEILSYMKKNFKQINFHHKASDLKPGDVMIYRRKDSKGTHYHIWIIVSVNGKLRIAEARQNNCYAYKRSNVNKALKHYDKTWLFRAK